MARKSKAQQEREDEAYRRTMQPELPMEEGQRRPASVKTFDRVPDHCPKCDKRMSFASGWALVFGDLLQCGNCSYLIEVPRSEYEAYARGLHQYFERMKSPPKPHRSPRSRGAG